MASMSSALHTDACKQRVCAERNASFPQIGNWELVCPIQFGSWTSVFQARPADSCDGQQADYVLKGVTADGDDRPAAIEMLQLEARLGVSIRHEHLVPVLADHTQSPPFFFVMPYLRGNSLAKILAQHKSIPVSQALWIARQTAEALAAIHLAGWRHGDVKPSNIFIAPDGHATLLDLGFARRCQKPRGHISQAFAGSVSYAAPETLTPVVWPNERADIYSLGVMLFEALVGQLPFANEIPEQLVEAHLRERPPNVRAFIPDVPPQLSRLLFQMLAKQPLRRPNASELVECLTKLEIDLFDERFAT
jgi:serine/threonine-protein kinase